MPNNSTNTNQKVKRVNFVNIPQELKSNASFCLWKYEKRNGRPTKVPYNPRNGQPAKTNDSSTFSDFSTAMTAYAMPTLLKTLMEILFQVVFPIKS